MNDYESKTLINTFKHLAPLFGGNLSKRRMTRIFDRQWSHVPRNFVDTLVDTKINHIFVTRERHGEYNRLAERQIQTLRQMARCTLDSARPSSKYWRFALAHAIRMKTMMPHVAVEKI